MFFHRAIGFDGSRCATRLDPVCFREANLSLGKDEKRCCLHNSIMELSPHGLRPFAECSVERTVDCRMSASPRSGLIASIGRLYQHDRQYRESFLRVC
jgi:hypothetical protein